MLKRNYLLLMIVFVTVCGLASVVYAFFLEDDTIYVLSEAQCNALFVKTPEEFCSEPYPGFQDYYQDWANTEFCKSTEIDEYGNLVLTMTKQQKERWKNSMDIYTRFYNAENNSSISISHDYTQIAVSCYEENASKNMRDAAEATYACTVFQLLDGIAPEEINVELTLIDAATKETVKVIQNSLEESKIGWSKSWFSSMYD